MLRASLILHVAFVLVFAPTAWSADIEPAPTTFVTDRAGIIDDATEHRLTGLLQELEQKTGARILVLTVDTTGGQDIHQYAFERADRWKLGANRKSASVLVVVAQKDRKYRFEVGYDWEHVLPDGYVGQLGRDVFVPHFRAGRFSQGIFEAAALMAGKIAKEKGVQLKGMPTLRQPTSRGPQPLLMVRFVFLGFVAFVLLLIVLSQARRGGKGFWGVHVGTGSGFGGGGFSGGFGSFGGGGGGGFGGGGAGGSW